MYNIQETIHLLPVPFVLAEEINSYLFYDKTTALMRKLHNEKMNEIVEKFTIAQSSRKRPDPIWFEHIDDVIDDPFAYDSDHCEQWATWLGDGNEIQFQGVNCRFCGNYKELTDLPLRICCSCND